MAEYSKNLGLELPEINEFYSIEKLNANFEKVDDVAHNPNLLDNGWFIVNSRGQTVYTIGASSLYVVDRWKMSASAGSKVTLVDGGINLVFGDRTSALCQMAKLDGGETYTVSVMLSDGTVDKKTFTLVESTNWVEVGSWLDGQFYIAYRYLGDGVYDFRPLCSNVENVNATIRAVKLEMGPYSTLANDHAPNYTDEVIRCVTSTADPNDTFANHPYNPTASNPNLLDNGWFTVNQRGVNGVIPAESYFADRWKTPNTGRCNVTYSRDAYTVRIESLVEEEGIIQYFENDMKGMRGKTVTFSVMNNAGVIRSVTFQVPSSSSDNAWHSYRVGNSDMYVKCNAREPIPGIVLYTSVGTDTSIKALKLEFGTVSTLYLDTAPDYATELLKCQRYFVAGIVRGDGHSTANNDHWIYLKTPTAMRTNPSIRVISGGSVIVGGKDIVYSNVSNVSVQSVHMDGVWIRMTVPSGVQYHTSIWRGANIELSADL